jgi:hypothetical protein
VYQPPVHTYAYMRLGPLGIEFGPGGGYHPGGPTKVAIGGLPHSTSHALVRLTGQRCSDGARLYFAYRDYQVPPGTRITQRSAARLGDAAGTFQLGPRDPAFGHQIGYAGYMLFFSRGDYGLTLSEGSKRIAEGVVRIS